MKTDHFRRQLDRAWSRARGGRPTPTTNAPVETWRRLNDSPTAMAIAARILHEQDSEPWKRQFDTYSARVNAQRAQRQVDWTLIHSDPLKAICIALWRRCRRVFTR